MSRTLQRALAILVALAALAGGWIAFDHGRWLAGFLASAAANVGAVWALMQGDRPPPRAPSATPKTPGTP